MRQIENLPNFSKFSFVFVTDNPPMISSAVAVLPGEPFRRDLRALLPLLLLLFVGTMGSW